MSYPILHAALPSLALVLSALVGGHGDDADVLDIAEFQKNLSVLTDDEGHYVAVVTFEGNTKEHSPGKHLFYGDGEDFWLQRSSGGSSSGSDKRFRRSFWEPRTRWGQQTHLKGEGDAYVLSCDSRETKLRALPRPQAEEMIAAATFHPTLWTRYAYALSRDDEGTYYFVDHALQPPGNYDYRLFRGYRGNVKLLKLVNIVSDSEGDIFMTRKGSLKIGPRGRDSARLAQWVVKRKPTNLVDVPVDRNIQLIYRNLGAYEGQRLGTPCDDL